MLTFSFSSPPPRLNKPSRAGSGKGQDDFIADTNDFGSGDIPFVSGEHTTVTSGNMVKHTATSGPSASAFMRPVCHWRHLVLPLRPRIVRRDRPRRVHAREDLQGRNHALERRRDQGSEPELQPRPAHRRRRAKRRIELDLALDRLPQPRGHRRHDLLHGFPDALTGKEWSSITGLPQTHAFAEGSGGVSGYLKANPYSIGYVDSGHGHAAGLSEIALKNKNGKFLQQRRRRPRRRHRGAEGTAAAVPSDFTDSFHAVSLMDQAGDTTWPICTFSYMYIRKDMSQWDDGPKAALVKAFAQFVLSDEGQGMLPDFGFKGIPTSLRTSARTQVDAISLPSGQTAWTFETSTGKDAAGSTITNPNDANIFSVKRQSWADVERESLVEDVAELKELVANLTAALEAQHPKKWYDDPKKQIEGAAAVGALGFIFAFVALVVGSVALNRVNKSGGGGWSNKGTMQI